MQKSRIGLSFQDHHTLQMHSTDDDTEQADKVSTGTHISHTKYFMEWTSSTQCTCPQAAIAGSEVQRLVSLTESPAPPQQQDFCEQTSIDKTRDSVTLLLLF